MSDRSEAHCVSNDLVERVALAIDSAICDGDQSSVAMELTSEEIKVLARAAIAVLRPAIRAEALEEAAKVVSSMPRTHTKIKEDHDILCMKGTWTFTLNNGPTECAAAIRALINGEKND